VNHYKLSPSRIFLALLLSAYVLAILIVFMLPIDTWARLMLAILLLCALFYYVRHDALRLMLSSIVGLRLEGDQISLIMRGGGELTGVIQPDSLVTPALTILNVLPHGEMRVRSLLIFPDSLDKEHFREMRVLLRWAYTL
jgi:toxin CptA